MASEQFDPDDARIKAFLQQRDAALEEERALRSGTSTINLLSRLPVGVLE
jgi:hypothetical protein